MVRWIRIHCARLLALFSIAIVFQSTCINIILLNLLSNGSIIFINIGRCIPSAISGREEGSALCKRSRDGDYWEIISIHAPHAGRDSFPVGAKCRYETFQSTRPMRGATILYQVPGRNTSRFQSTRPMRGATQSAPPGGFHPADFNPRAPCGARRDRRYKAKFREVISIHAPHAGRDRRSWRTRPPFCDFNPRAPCGARRAGSRSRPWWS